WNTVPTDTDQLPTGILTARNGNLLSCLGVIVLSEDESATLRLPSQPEEGESSGLLRRKPPSSKNPHSRRLRQSSIPSPLRPYKAFKKNPLSRYPPRRKPPSRHPCRKPSSRQPSSNRSPKHGMAEPSLKRNKAKKTSRNKNTKRYSVKPEHLNHRESNPGL
ncbi:hypothetical protein FJTKL_08600, partial [Diaporthe vaccinii]